MYDWKGDGGERWYLYQRNSLCKSSEGVEEYGIFMAAWIVRCGLGSGKR